MTTILECTLVSSLRSARKDGKKSQHDQRDHIAQFINMNGALCKVLKWHTSSRKISLRASNCLAKINPMLAAGLH
jgi:hypothetical protein